MNDMERLFDKEINDKKELAESILDRAIKSIIRHSPGLGCVFYRFSLKPVESNIKLSTDGEWLYYNPVSVVRTRQKNGMGEIQRQLLHVIIHYLNGDILRYRESAHKELCGAIMDAEVNDIINALKDNPVPKDTGNKAMYYRLKYNPKAADAFIKKEGEMYKSDEHSLWLVPLDEGSLKEQLEQVLSDIFGKEVKELLISGRSSLGTELCRSFGKELSALLTGMAADNSFSIDVFHSPKKSKTDYREVVNKFLSRVCMEREDFDFPDRNLYCYGLSLYEDMPLLEPGEDEKLYRSISGRLAIAVDTSGSCAGDVADRFLGELGKIISQIFEECEERNLEVIYFECDSSITRQERYKDDAIIRCLKEKRSLRGGGGTSFVPVFERLSEIEKKEGKPVSGLIYLTDGIGKYPERKPSYPVAFVMPSDAQYCRGLEIPDYIEKTWFKD